MLSAGRTLVVLYYIYADISLPVSALERIPNRIPDKRHINLIDVYKYIDKEGMHNGKTNCFRG